MKVQTNLKAGCGVSFVAQAEELGDSWYPPRVGREKENQG